MGDADRIDMIDLRRERLFCMRSADRSADVDHRVRVLSDSERSAV
jgi:hypothetical protein